MRFLADESCDFAPVRALHAAGHDVVAVSEVARGAEDSVVIELARSEQRVLLTEDKDFGQLVFAAARQSSGVVLLRWPVSARGSRPHRKGNANWRANTYRARYSAHALGPRPGRSRKQPTHA